MSRTHEFSLVARMAAFFSPLILTELERLETKHDPERHHAGMTLIPYLWSRCEVRLDLKTTMKTDWKIKNLDK